MNYTFTSNEYAYVLSGNNSLTSSPNSLASNTGLIIKAGATVNLNTFPIITSGGTITVESGATINFGSYGILLNGGSVIFEGGVPNCVYLKQSGALKGYYGSIQSAINYAASNQTVELQARTYSENPSFSSKSNITLTGQGSGSTTINGNITVTNSYNIQIYSIEVNGAISTNSTQLTYVTSDLLSSSTILNDYGSTQTTLANSIATYGTTSFAVNSYGGTGSIFSNTISNHDCAVYLTSSASYNVGDQNTFCGNLLDIYVTNGAYAYAISNIYSQPLPQSIYGNVFVTGTNGVCGLSKSSIREISQPNSIYSESLKEVDKKYLTLLRKINDDTKKEKYDKVKYSSDFSGLIEECKHIISLEDDKETFKAALSKLNHLYKAEEEKKSFMTYLNMLANSKVNEQYLPYIKRYSIWAAVDNKDYSNSISIADEVLKTANNDEDLICEMLYEEGLIYKYYLGDKENAKKVFTEIMTTYPNKLMAKFAAAETGIEFKVDEDYNSLDNQEVKKFSIDNYPNPFNPSTKISFTIPEKGNVKLRVFDVLGREISLLANGVYEAGKYEVSFNASNLPSGIYFCNLVSGSNSITKKMLLVK